MAQFNLLKNDPLTTTNFYIEIDSAFVTNVTSIDGLNVEIEVADFNERTSKGQLVQHKVMAKPKWNGELTMKRIAPLKADDDDIWKWFNDLRTKGMTVTNRSKPRRHGSVVVYDSALVETARWNFYDAWPSKIEFASLEASANEVAVETITLQYEKLERKK
ncbi:phage tail protein, partial [Ferrimicrobium sp.]|uniref:phage tail protein n=2 Tax=Ferrimicrobium sp. TaxID=2926050 RepID=UPI0026127941